MVSVVLLGLCLPVMAAVAQSVRSRLGRPVIFRQVRPGRHGKPFVMYKFRTLTQEVDEKGELLPDEQRMTRFGQWLRKSSLDELPELINVVKGDMSLVGPRPLLMQYLGRYTAQQARRNEVKPGITGWAQIHGRNAISWPEKFRLDVWYVDNQSFWLDIAILIRTLAPVFNRSGINSQGRATVEEFMGDGDHGG